MKLIAMLFAGLSALIYLISWAFQIHSTFHKNKHPWVKTAVAVGFLLQAIWLYQAIFQQVGVDLGFFIMMSLVSWMFVGILLLSGIRKPVDNLYIFLLPLAFVSAIAGEIWHTDYALRQDFSPGIGIHIVTAILAYATLTIASVQATLLAYQHQRLRKHQLGGLLLVLPPLQTMERLLFEMLMTGFLLLTLSVIAGVTFWEFSNALNIAPKLVLTLGAWATFAALIIGHFHLGWRGATASYWTLTGFGILMAAFFGTKIAVSLIG